MADDVIARERLGALAADVERALDQLVADDAVARIWSGDHTLWAPDPTEITDRLGWLHVAGEVLSQRDRLDGFVDAIAADGVTHAVVMGMGGSSLFPEVMARTFPTQPGRLALTVLDTTDATAIARIEATCPLDQTLFIASSKSGSTVETRSHLAHFWEKVGRADRFAVITDPGSDLGELARERGFREIFENRPDIGGRYSALSYFGLVPAAVSGVDWTAMVQTALDLEPALRQPSGGDNPGLRLGAIFGAAVKAGRDKLTLVIDGRIVTFGLWLEQLLAESTGKHGTGVIPVAGEPLGPATVYGDDRLFVVIGETPAEIGLDVLADAGHPVVQLALDGPLQIGRQVLLWEFATAVCGAVLGINAFDQPNVAEAKEATKKVLASGPPDIPVTPLADLLAQVVEGDYVAVQAYVDPGDPMVDDLQEARVQLRDELHVATTFGLGPRYLHSTGQLHKGGPPTGVFVQVVAMNPTDAPIPGESFTFAQLEHAQADGDFLTLRDHGLRVARVTIEDLENR
ncbi:MAG: glucose-6-phosphate isomerase [Actinomycetota bacterium]|nr:glucose-6-phosphate isomerase [Actinomycetota bacterium]